MLTHHLLLLGYSLSDDSFVRLARQVRALHGRRGGRAAAGPAVGTVLTLQHDPLVAELWQGTFAFLSGGPQRRGPAAGGEHASAARALELLLDDLARLAADDAPYALHPAYRTLLDTGPAAPLVAPLQALHGACRDLGDHEGTRAPDDPVAAAVARLLASLGAQRC
jgi:hypothetical protein